MAFIGWIQWSLSQPKTQADYDYPYTRNTTVLRYKVGTHRMNIPINYNMGIQPTSSYKEIFDTASPPGLRALWPDLKAYSKETEKEFNKLGLNNKILITIKTTHWYQPIGKFDPTLSQLEKVESGNYLPKHMFYHEVYKRQSRGVEGSYQHDRKVPPEFIYYANNKDTIEMKDYYFNIYAVLEQGEYLYSAMCSGSESSSSCRAFFKYSNDIVVRYIFSLHLLKHWREIEKKIRNLIISFEQAANHEKNATIQ